MMGRGLFPLSVLRVLSCFTYLFDVEEATPVDRAAFSPATEETESLRIGLQLQIGKQINGQ